MSETAEQYTPALTTKPKRQRKGEVREGLSYADYAALPGLRSSHLKAGMVSMLHMRDSILHPQADTPAMALGRLIHLAVLEPQRLLQAVAVWEGGTRRGTEWEQFKEQHAAQEIVKRDDLDQLTGIMEAVAANREAATLIAATRHEVTLVWQGPRYGAAQYRADGLGGGAILEVKSTRDIEPRAFMRQFIGLGYHVQLGWGVEGAARCGVTADAVYVVAVETSTPYDVAVYKVASDLIAAGRKEAVRLARQYRQCEKAGKWPGVQEGVGKIEMPKWMEQPVELVIGGQTVEA